MHQATVITSGIEEHPESGRSLLKLMVAWPYKQAGQECSTTDLWVDHHAPIPAFGDTVEWSSHQVIIAGRAWKKVEYDSPSNEPLH